MKAFFRRFFDLTVAMFAWKSIITISEVPLEIYLIGIPIIGIWYAATHEDD